MRALLVAILLASAGLSAATILGRGSGPARSDGPAPERATPDAADEPGGLAQSVRRLLSREAPREPGGEADGPGVYYQYVDETGSVRFVRSLAEVPPAHRAGAGRVEVDPRASTHAARASRPATRRARAFAPEPEVVVYTTSWCGWCRRTLAWLDAQGVRYRNKDIEADDRHRDELLRKTGRTSIPVVEIDGELVRGYDPARMQELLGSS
jgi:glutaredoxin-like YruB-family protein